MHEVAVYNGGVRELQKTFILSTQNFKTRFTIFFPLKS